MAKNFIYFNGQIIPSNKAKISPYDLGIMRGYGVFDVMRAQNQKPFLLTEHFHRLINSARELKLTIPFSQKEYGEILKKLLKLNKFKKSIIRTILTGGFSKNGFSRERKPTCYILIEKFKNMPSRLFQKGAKVISIDFERYLPRVKTTNYVEAIRNQELLKKRGATEIIYIKNNEVLEASASNLFIFKNNVLATPKEKILFGITRKMVINLAKKKFKIEERKISKKELFAASEVFLTSTIKDIVPIVQIDNKKIRKGEVGKNTKTLMEIFKNFSKNY